MTETTATSDARSAIFSSIREHLAASARYDAVHSKHGDQSAAGLPADVSTSTGLPNLVDAFAANLELVGAHCVILENEDRAAARLHEIIEGPQAKTIVVSDSPFIERLIDAAAIQANDDPSREELFASDIGITSAQWAIADTGTLVLASGAERHRLISLVPPVHVCVLAASSIRQTMAEILELLDTDADRTVTFVTGASRTSDIELTLAIGVHGPGELHVIVVKDQ